MAKCDWTVAEAVAWVREHEKNKSIFETALYKALSACEQAQVRANGQYINIALLKNPGLVKQAHEAITALLKTTEPSDDTQSPGEPQTDDGKPLDLSHLLEELTLLDSEVTANAGSS